MLAGGSAVRMTSCAAWKLLADGIVNLPARVALGAFFMDILHDAGDENILSSVVGQNVAHGAAIRPVGELIQESLIGLVDKNDIRAGRAVVPLEVAASDAGAHGAHVAGRNDVDQRSAHAGRRLDAFGERQAPGTVLAERQKVGNPRGLDAGNGTHAGDNLLEDVRLLLQGVFARLGVVAVIHHDGCGMLGLESKIDVENFEKAAQQESRAHQEHAGQRNLSDHQGSAQPLMLTAHAGTGAGVLERFLQVA